MKTILMDMDSTLVDLLTPWLAWYNQKFSDELEIGDIDDWGIENCVKAEAKDAIFEFLDAPDVFLNMVPMSGAVEAVTRWHESGHDLLFVTACADNVDIHAQKHAWLQKYFPWYKKDSLFFTGIARGRIRADILIDDKPANLLEFKRYNPESQAWAIAFPYNAEVQDRIELRAWGYAEPQAAWETFDRTVREDTSLTVVQRMCLAPLPDGKLCRNLECDVHNKLAAPGESYYPKAVWDMLGTLASTSRMDTMDAELAYLHTLPDRIEAEIRSGAIVSKDGVDLLIKSVKEIMAGKERMAAHLANQKLMVHRDVIQGLLVQIGTILRRYINDDVLLDKIGKDVRNIQITVDTKIKKARYKP